MLIYKVYQDEKNEWRWRLKAENGNIIADSGEGYVNKSDCLHGIELVKNSATAPIQKPVTSVKGYRQSALRMALKRASLN